MHVRPRPSYWSPLVGNGCGCLALINNERRYLSLLGVEAHATILSASSRTTVMQTFQNPTASTLEEVRYIFPLFDGVSVVSFTCTIGSRIIKGIVKEKTQAKAMFQSAVADGRKAALFEQSESAADVFTATLGNLGPLEKAVVEITYLGELKHDAEVDGLRYTMPTSIAPRYDADRTVRVVSGPRLDSAAPTSMKIIVDLDMASGSSIKSVQSPSHPIAVTIGTTSTKPSGEPSLQRASASFSLSQSHLDRDFIVQVCASNLGTPSAVLETHPTIPNRRAVMATLVPRFNLPVDNPEVVFVCDRSGSMGQGERIPNLVSALKIFLKSLPVGVLFNICSFGTRHDFLWSKSQPYDQRTLEEATLHVQRFQSNYGGTEMREAIQDTFERRDAVRNLEVFLMTDGEIWNQQDVFDMINRYVSDSKGEIRLFSLGVGRDVSHALIEGVARAGNGFSQTVAEDEKMDKKVVRMLKGALTPHVRDYSVELKYEKTDEDEFELVEKLDECLTFGRAAASGDETLDTSDTAASEKQPISLHDTTIKDEDLQMPYSSDKSTAVSLPDLETPRYLQTPSDIPPLFPFSRTNLYIILSENGPSRQPKSVVLRGSSKSGPLVLEMPIKSLEERGTTVHQLAAKKATQDLEEGRGWVYRAKSRSGKLMKEEYAMSISDIARRAAVKIGVEYQVSGKWCSFVAVDEGLNENGDEGFEVVQHRTSQHAMPSKRGGPPMLATLSATRSRAVPQQLQLQQQQQQQLQRNPQMSGVSRPMSMPRQLGMGMQQPESHLEEPRGFQSPAHQYECAEDTETKESDIAEMVYPGSLPTRWSPVSACMEADEEISDNELDCGTRRLRRNSETKRAGKRMKVSDNPVEEIIALQTFAGSWGWSDELERLVGVKQHDAACVKLPASIADQDHFLATLCTIVYLKTKQAGQKEVWELVVEKAESWISNQTQVEIPELERMVEGLF